MAEKKTDGKMDWLLIGGAALGIWYFFFRKPGNGGNDGNGLAQFRALEVTYQGTPSSPVIEKYPGDSWGGTLSFEHKGAGKTFWFGLAFAYDRIFGHEAPFIFTTTQFTVPDDPDWTPYTVTVTGIILGMTQKDKFIDVMRFISNSRPVVGQDPPDDYGVNMWQDNIYVVREKIGAAAFRTLSVSYI